MPSSPPPPPPPPPPPSLLLSLPSSSFFFSSSPSPLPRLLLHGSVVLGRSSYLVSMHTLQAGKGTESVKSLKKANEDLQERCQDGESRHKIMYITTLHKYMYASVDILFSTLVLCAFYCWREGELCVNVSGPAITRVQNAWYKLGHGVFLRVKGRSK